jgi:hypothetical protein
MKPVTLLVLVLTSLMMLIIAAPSLLTGGDMFGTGAWRPLCPFLESCGNASRAAGAIADLRDGSH